MREEVFQNWLHNRKKHKESLTAEILFEKIISGDRNALSAGITLIESLQSTDQTKAAKLIEMCMPYTGKSFRIGITGIPGVGKSTFIESFGKVCIDSGKKVAVLSIDPSSDKTNGSILGDKTRMVLLSTSENAFIRPTSSGNTFGGVARATREAIMLCEAAGYDLILIETVGVGQSETSVNAMVDLFLLLMLSGAGDELQGIKRGIMELADVVLITKADRNNIELAKRTKQIYSQALHYFPTSENDWMTRVLTYSCEDILSVKDVQSVVLEFERFVKHNNYFESNRHKQQIYWMRETIKQLFESDVRKIDKSLVSSTEKSILNGEISPFKGAEIIYNELIKKYNGN